jgi:hypothetical protein
MGMRMIDACNHCETCRSCGRREPIKEWYCDSCMDNDTDLYEYEGEELCASCILKRLPKVEME